MNGLVLGGESDPRCQEEKKRGETIKRKRWDRMGDSIYRRGRSWVLDFRHKGQQSILTERLA